MRLIFFIAISLFHFGAQAQLDAQLIMPPFLRQGDRTEIKAVIKNGTPKEITGQAEMQLTNAQSGESVDGWFQNVFPAQYLTIAANGSDTLRFPVEVPYLFYNTLAWKLVVRLPSTGKDSTAVIAKTSVLPILTNKTISSELAVLSPGKQQANLQYLLQSDNREDIEQRSLSICTATDPAVLVYDRLLQQANGNGQTILDAGNRFFALIVLQSARFKPAWPVVQSQLNNLTALERNASQKSNVTYPQAQQTGEAFLNLAAFQTSTGGFSRLLTGEADLGATVQATRQLIWLSQLQMIPQVLNQQVSDVLAKATRWLYRQSIAEMASPAAVQVLPELFYTYSIMSYSDEAKNRLPQLMQKLQYEKTISPQGKVYHLLGLRNSLSSQHQQLFQQISSDTALLPHPDVAAMLLTYAAAEKLESLKPNLVETLLQNNGDASWAAYALLRTFTPANVTLQPFALQLGTQTVQVPDSSSFFVKTFQPPFIKASMGSVTASAAHPWTLVKWMYHQEETSVDNPGVIKKSWFIKNRDGMLQPVAPGVALQVGDVLTVRLTLTPDAAAYNWTVQDSWPAAMALLQSSQNRSTLFTSTGMEFNTYGLQSPYTLEYNLVVKYAGSFSSGITTVEVSADKRRIASLPAQTFYIE